MVADRAWWQPLGLALLLLGVLAVVALFLYRRRRERDALNDDEDSRPLPPLIFPVRQAPAASSSGEPGTTPLPATAVQRENAPASGSTPVAVSSPESPSGEDVARAPALEPPRSTRAPDRPLSIRFAIVSPPPEDATGPAASSFPDSGAPAANGPVPPLQAVTVGSIRYHRPPEGTLQLLPGRLEIMDGGASQKEIRFVREPGKDPVVTFGRATGVPLSHIQLDAPTVSRMHARMHFRDGVWRIVNLSHTNPVLLNGTRLSSNGAETESTLKDGDRLEMGEVVFRFRIP
ncbi:MAG: FHA domain-containing protein [Longimicrobiales bacterium]